MSKATLETLYRGQLAMRKDLENQLAIIRLDLGDVRRDKETMRILAGSVRHLLKQNDTLRFLVSGLSPEEMQRRVSEANRFMAAGRNARGAQVTTLTDEVPR